MLNSPQTKNRSFRFKFALVVIAAGVVLLIALGSRMGWESWFTFFQQGFEVDLGMSGAAGNQVRISPSDAWCNVINQAAPGTEVVFAPGQYSTTCSITVRGTAAAPVVVRSEVEGQAAFTYGGTTSNVLEVRGAAYLTIRGFAFGPTQRGVDGIRLHQVNNILIERNTFTRMGGVSIPANDTGTTIPGLIIRDNRLIDLQTTGIYLGCHEGNCKVQDAVVERNFINGVVSPGTGYGVEIKLNSYATLRDNTVYNPQGPGLMVYGSNQGDPPSIVEGNYIEGSRNEGGVVVGGGPAIVRNNVLVNNARGGVSVQNYGGRNLLTNIQIVGNTMIRNTQGGVDTAWAAGTGNVIAYNAILLSSGTTMFSPTNPPGTIVGNVNCTSTCFVQVASAPYNISPRGPLLGAMSGSESFRPADDFMGNARSSSSESGAVSSAAQSVLVGNFLPRPPRGGSSLPPNPSDLNADDRVDVIDLGILLSNWNSTAKPKADINQDGRVDVVDLGILLSKWS